VSLDRESPDFFANSANLFIPRNDLRPFRNWEGSVEGRMLRPDRPERAAHRALFAVYRYLGGHFKVGVGYDFTDFSDDLTDLSYDDHGLLLNVVGTSEPGPDPVDSYDCTFVPAPGIEKPESPSVAENTARSTGIPTPVCGGLKDVPV